MRVLVSVMKFKLLGVILILSILIGSGVALASDGQGVDDTHSFKEFCKDIENANGTFDMVKDYKYVGNDSELLPYGDLVINGNGHKIDGSKLSAGLSFVVIGSKDKIVINNLTISNFSKTPLTADNKEIVLNNVVFEDNSGEEDGIASFLDSDIVLNNCTFKSNSNASEISLLSSNASITNTTFLGDNEKFSAIFHDRGSLKMDNCTLENYSPDYGGILSYKGNHFSIKNSNFTNSNASITGGGILGKYFPKIVGNSSVPSEDMLIENCRFCNLSSSSNGGAIYMDLDSGSDYIPKTMNIVNSSFVNCSSKYGGDIVNLGGTLNIENSRFINSSANSIGGALYTSWSNVTISNSTISNNTAKTDAGAIYFDYGQFTIKNSNLTGNNGTSSGNVIYSNDAQIQFEDSIFHNDAVVYGNFNDNPQIKNMNSTDRFSMNNTDYIVSVENKGIKLNIKNNTVNTSKLPSKYDSREHGWASPIKEQGDNFACWAFATAGALECSLLKSTGTLYNISENNIQNMELRYSPVGDMRNNATGFAYSGLGHSLSWNGIVTSQDDPYDQRGMISEVPQTDNRIHLQDAKIIFGGRNDTEDLIKKAVMEDGAVSMQYLTSFNTYTYNDKVAQPTHFSTIIGWDDTIPAKKFTIQDENKTPSRPGGWIIKNSEGLGLGDKGYDYESFDDKTFLANDYFAIVPQAAAVSYVFENDIDYHVNYQTDLTGLVGFDSNYTHYSNEFESKYNESIGAVGTYFNESGIDYSFDVYVNDKLVHSQNGSSEFAGFRTIVLDKYVPVKSGDKFKVVFKSNAVPYQAFSRQHYMSGMTFVSNNGESWSDITFQNKTVCLKAYTVDGDSK